MEAVLTLQKPPLGRPFEGLVRERGLILDHEGNLLVDLQKSRSFRVRGYNTKGECREYLLRVSDSGKLSLV
jgi:hypothetical protein